MKALIDGDILRIRHWFKPDMAGILEVKNEYESVD